MTSPEDFPPGLLLKVRDEEEEPAGEPATPEAIRASFCAPELWYGTVILLCAPTGEVLECAAATEMFMAPDVEGEFYLAFERPMACARFAIL